MLKILGVLLLLGGVGAAAMSGIDYHIAAEADGRCHRKLDAVPSRPVALVLGTSKFVHGGRENRFYRARITAAAALYKAGKVRGILLSGDNSRHTYNEPEMMRNDLVALGVPADYIAMDFAGFRTLDSVVRSKLVFGQPAVVIVSQRFHCQRAVYLADAYGLDAVGYAARDVPGVWGLKIRLREVLARTQAFLDVHVLNRQPKFLGKKEVVLLRPN